MSHWVTLDRPITLPDGRVRAKFCVNGCKDERQVRALVHKLCPHDGSADAYAITGVARLPYPASPQLNPTDFPAFCMQPDRCKGRGSCPRSLSCTE